MLPELLDHHFCEISKQKYREVLTIVCRRVSSKSSLKRKNTLNYQWRHWGEGTAPSDTIQG